MRRLITGVTILSWCFGLVAEAQPTDSIRRRPPMVSVREMVGIVGAIGVAAALDTKVRSTVQDGRTAFTNDAAQIGNSLGSAKTVGPALMAGWLIAKATGHHEAAKATVWAAGAGAAAGLITVVLKEAIGRARPPAGDAFRFHPLSGDASFPSGHTSFAFAIASSLAHSTPDHWSDLLFYGAATATGLSRINDDRHWLSDVVGGAALGILTGRQLRFRAAGVAPLAGNGILGLTIAF
jgi:membrane-associated phospholipid phosphatase